MGHYYSVKFFRVLGGMLAHFEYAVRYVMSLTTQNEYKLHKMNKTVVKVSSSNIF